MRRVRGGEKERGVRRGGERKGKREEEKEGKSGRGEK